MKLGQGRPFRVLIVECRDRQDLHLSIPTVKTHISRLLAKLRVPNRVQLVAIAYESGIVSPGGRGQVSGS